MANTIASERMEITSFAPSSTPDYPVYAMPIGRLATIICAALLGAATPHTAGFGIGAVGSTRAAHDITI